MNLSEFLLARIAEDEEVAREALVPGLIGPEWWDKTEHGRVYSGHWVPVVETSTYQEPAPEPGEVGTTHHGLGRDALPHIARWDPSRVLAECEAKRFVIDALRGYEPSDEWGVEPDIGKRANNAAGALRRLALPYADHRDYRSEWTP